MANIFNLAKPLTIENEVSRLKAEKQSLLEELQQCQTDKDFVWSLWKRLQVASPDITEAIGMVVHREKEKAELKDAKVLEILEGKDSRIQELQREVANLSQGAGSTQAMKLEMQTNMQRLQNENETLKAECTIFKRKIQDLEGKEHELGSRQAIREMDKDILDLKQKLSNREKEVTSLSDDIKDLSSIRDTQQDRITHIEKEHKSLGEKYQKLSMEYTDAKKQLKRYENEITILGTNLKDKTEELDSARAELSTIWQTQSKTSEHSTQQADVIRQLRTLQKDTQQMMKQQENTFSMETAALQAQLVEQEDLIAELERQLLLLGVQSRTGTGRVHNNKEIQTESEVDMDPPAAELATDLNFPRGHASRSRSLTRSRGLSPHHRHRSKEGLQKSPQRTRSPSSKGRHPRSKSEPRSRSLERSKRVTVEHGPETLQRRLEISERKFTELKGLVQVKNEELEEMKMAHARRLERLRSLQSNYRLVKKQLKITEEELNGPRKKRRKIPRADIKSLQKEDSDKVWNELAFFRNENSNLIVERMNLQEEVDLLRVQTAQDAATIYELRSGLEQEREELEFLTEMQQQEEKERCPSPKPDLELELTKARKEMRRLHKQLRNLQEDALQVSTDRDQALNDRRELKAQVNALQQKDADYRIKIADLNRDLARSYRELKRRRKPRGKSSYVARQYQRSLNRSIKEMQTSFENFNQDGWEEVSDTEDTALMDATGTTDSLGQQIVDQADTGLRQDHLQARPPRGGHTNRQKDAEDVHIHRMKQRGEPQNKDAPVRHRSPSPVRRRDIALSPIHFLSSKSTPTDPLPSRSPTTISAGVGTSPLTPGAPSARRAAASSNAVIRQVNTLKQRIHTLQQQVTLLRTSRDNATTKNRDYKDQIDHMQAELVSTNQKLQTSRLTVQRLSTDLDRIRGDKEVLEAQVEDGINEGNVAQRTEQEWNNLQARLKTASSEVSKQLTQIKNLKSQHSEQADKIQQLQDRINHLERDLSQKRTLVDDMKVKLRFAQESAQNDADAMLEVDSKVKNLTESNNRYKTQVESFRQRLAAVSKEKHENDRKVLKLSAEIDRKMKQVSDLQHRNAELQKTVIALEKTAQEQLHVLANQSEAAIDVAHSKLSQVHGRLLEHDKFVKIFTHALLNSLQQARSLWQHQARRGAPGNLLDQDVSLRQACDILNLTAEERDDIISLDGDHSARERVMPVDLPDVADDLKRDKKWAKKVIEISTNKFDFAVPLTEMFMAKVDERNKLAAKLQS